MSQFVKELTDDLFTSEVLQAAVPVLVEFWTPWCGPCRSLAPVLDEVAQDSHGRLTVGKLNADEHKKSSVSYSVLGVPTLILFKEGQEIARHCGYLTKFQLMAFINNHLTQ